jgi:hypothetical protein
MTIARIAFPALLAFVWASAQAAHDPRCDAPPYGDTPQNYSALVAAFTRAQQTQPNLPPNLMMTMMLATLQTACEAKFGGDRTMFHQAGLSDHYIDAHGPVKLTSAWFASRNKALAKDEASNPPGYQYRRAEARGGKCQGKNQRLLHPTRRHRSRLREPASARYSDPIQQPRNSAERATTNRRRSARATREVT